MSDSHIPPRRKSSKFCLIRSQRLVFKRRSAGDEIALRPRGKTPRLDAPTLPAASLKLGIIHFSSLLF